MIICVTGKIGTGKSTVSRFFENLGFAYINVDKLGHIAFEMNIEKILNAFGTRERKEIVTLVFKDQQKLRMLESIVHPTIRQLLEEELKKHNGKNIVVEAAIRRRLQINCCDVILTVVSSIENIKKRLSGKYPEDLIVEILEKQDDVFEEGIVVENNGTIEELEKQLENIWKKIS
ncbi:MAG: dephospho-CoA kinase [Fervidobacterium sp.]